jgi:hypothetical protein
MKILTPKFVKVIQHFLKSFSIIGVDESSDSIQKCFHKIDDPKQENFFSKPL